jgi:indole-3-glycerol phosphate synthase
MSILDKIIEKKKERLSSKKSNKSLSDLKSKIKDIEPPLDFKCSIKRNSGRIKIIAEIKKASPIKGILRKDFNHIEICKIYEKSDINAISIITEEDFFLGSLEYLSDIRKLTTKPILRKDFIFDEYQIYESRANYADAILLIASIIDNYQASDYLHLSKELGLSVLFEVHNFKELEKALTLGADIIGINNRNLETMHIDINTTLNLIKEIPESYNVIIVSESGIKLRDDVKKMEDTKVDALLIGTALMEAEDIEKKIQELIGR